MAIEVSSLLYLLAITICSIQLACDDRINVNERRWSEGSRSNWTKSKIFSNKFGNRLRWSTFAMCWNWIWCWQPAAPVSVNVMSHPKQRVRLFNERLRNWHWPCHWPVCRRRNLRCYHELYAVSAMFRWSSTCLAARRQWPNVSNRYAMWFHMRLHWSLAMISVSKTLMLPFSRKGRRKTFRTFVPIKLVPELRTIGIHHFQWSVWIVRWT